MSSSTARPAVELSPIQRASLGRSRMETSASRRRAVGEDQPDEPRSDDQPDDQQPPVEVGVHPPSVASANAHGARPTVPGQPVHSAAMIDFTPDPVFFRILGLPIYWYGIAYAVGLAVVYWVVIREARFRGLDETIVGTGMIVIAVAALIGGRLYHVIDQWHLYEAHPITALLPIAIQPDGSYAFAGFTGLGVPGGIVTGDRRLPVRPLEAPELPAVGRRRRARPVRHAGDRSLGELLQPGALRAADDAAVGHPDRLRPSDRGIPVLGLPGGDDLLPPAVPVRVAVRDHRRARPDLARCGAGRTS